MMVFATTMVTAVAGWGALALLLPYLDRLRQMTWRTHLWRVVGMHMAWALWLGAVAYRALTLTNLGADSTVDPHDVFGLAGAALWLVTSHATWRAGPPAYSQSSPAPLDDAAPGRAF